MLVNFLGKKKKKLERKYDVFALDVRIAHWLHELAAIKIRTSFWLPAHAHGLQVLDTTTNHHGYCFNFKKPRATTRDNHDAVIQSRPQTDSPQGFFAIPLHLPRRGSINGAFIQHEKRGEKRKKKILRLGWGRKGSDKGRFVAMPRSSVHLTPPSD